MIDNNRIIDKLNKVLSSKNYTLPIGELVCICIRNSDRNSGTFNDIEIQYRDGAIINIFDNVTTDPSDASLITMKNPKGVAIVKAGYYPKMWVKGLHKGKPDHPALVQHSKCTVIRDFNKDIRLDIDVVFNTRPVIHRYETSRGIMSEYYVHDVLVRREEEGIFGINNHRASRYNILPKIGPYSEGCIVHNDYKRFMEVFMTNIDAAIAKGQNFFDLVMLDEKDFI